MEKLLAEDLGALRLLLTEDLYKVEEPEVVHTDSPVSGIDAHSVETTPAPPVFSYLGENNKYFVILVADKEHPHLNSTDLDTLVKILQAKGMDLRDVAIVNVERHPQISFSQVKEFFVPSRIVFFGLSTAGFGIPSIGANLPEKHQDVRLLSTYSFDEMQGDINKKKAFWNVMKSF